MHFAIVSYTFPPSKAIGGRRWAKFSQQLAKKGHEVTVVTANIGGDSSFYEKEFQGIKFKFLPKNYPEWLIGNSKNLFEKVLYWITTKLLAPLVKQNFFDKGIAWKRSLLNTLNFINSLSNIDVLIATGGPFSLLYYCTYFKRKNSNIKLVCDLRDPWTWGYLYGMKEMSKRKRKYQLFQELEVVKNSDFVSAPTKQMINTLNEFYSEYSAKLLLLPHAFEPHKFSKPSFNAKRKGFIYGGTLYGGIEGYLKKLAIVLNDNPGSSFYWSIYSGAGRALIEDKFQNNKVSFHDFIPEEALFKRIMESSAYLVFYPPTDKDLISTKFFEIVYCGTPIIYIGEEGEVGKFVRENNLGVHILPEKIESEMPKYLNGNIPFEIGLFDVSKYTFSNVADSFIETLKE